MANNKVKVDIIVDDNGSLKQTSKSAKNAADNLNNAGASARTFDRKMKGASRASSNATKNFSKMAEGSGGIAGIYAQIAANVFAVSAAFQFLKTSADISKLIKGQEALGSVTGVAYKSMTKSIQEATGSQIAYQEAAQAAAIGTAAGLSASQLDSLASAARNTSTALGRDLTDSFNRLIRGVTKAEPELLDELGIVLRLEPATRKYAQAIGKTANQLNAFERTQAVANEVLEQTEEKFGKIAAIMDPSGESLNRFLVSFDNVLLDLRQGLITILGPVFDFLSKNTSALIVAMAAVSALIVKTLIPDFGKYASAAKASSFKIKRSLVLQRQEVEKLKLQYESLNNSASAAATKSVKSFNKIAKSKNLGAGQEGGRKALDFLSGASDSKVSRVNAERSVNAAIAAMEKGNKVKSDLLKDFSREELNIAKDTLEKRKRLLLVQEKATQQTYGRMDLALQKFKAKTMLAFNGLGAAMISWAGRTAGAVNAALSFAGWIGAIVALGSLLYSVGKSAYEYFFPVSEATKKATEETEAYLETMTSVNDELSKMVKVRQEVELTTRALVEQTGQAAASADAVDKALKLLELQKLKQRGIIDSEQFDKAKTEFTGLLITLSKLAPELKEVSDLFEKTGKIDVEKLQTFQNTAISFSTASKELGRNLASVRTELSNISGSVTKNPFDTLLKNTKVALKSSQTLDEGLRKQLDRRLLEIRSKQDSLPSLEERVPDEIIEFNKLAKQAKDTEEEIANIGKETTFLLNLSTRLQAVQAEYTSLSKESARATKQSVQDKRIEYTLEDKKANILAAFLTKENSLRSAKQKLLIKEANLRATIDADPRNSPAIQAAALEVSLAMQLVDTEEAKLNLSKEQRKLAIDIINIQIEHKKESLDKEQTLLGLKNQSFSVLQKEANLQQQLNTFKQQAITLAKTEKMQQRELNSPVGTYVFNRSKLEEKDRIFAERNLNKLKMEQAEADKNIALAKLNLEKSQFDLAQKRLALELAVLNRKRNIKTSRSDGLTDEQGALFDRINSTSLSAFSTQGIAIQEAFRAAAKAIQSANVQLDISEKNLDSMTELANGAASAFETGLGNAFNDIISGTKSVSDAFRDMAISILQSMSKIVANQLASTLLESLIPSGTSTPSDLYAGGPDIDSLGNVSSGNYARYGGVFSSSGKLPGYSTGGIASGPQRGYPVMMHGTEAIVPLPNGKEIPVQMKGNSGGVNNVSVSVNIDNSGKSETQTNGDADGAALGKAVALAVQEELKNQKRSGGILNPYGVA